VRAGSSGKPNAQQDREQWGKIMPIVSEAMEKVATLRLNGQFDMADAVIALLRETLKRFEENLDVDALIPPVKKDENGQPIAQQQAIIENQKMKQQLEELQQNLEECQQLLQKAQAGEQSKAAKVEADKAIALAQEQARAQEESSAADRASDERIAEEETTRFEAQQKAEAERATAAAEQARCAAEDAQHEREVDAKLELDKHTAILKAATQLLGDQIAAAAQARAKDAEAQDTAEKEAFSEARMGTLVGDLKKTMDALGKSFDGMLAESKGRTKMIGEHLAAISNEGTKH
jgi:membrane protein involved in colicin uptake